MVIIVGGAIIVAALAIAAVFISEQSRVIDSQPDRAWPLESDGLEAPVGWSQWCQPPPWVNDGDDWGQWEDELA